MSWFNTVATDKHVLGTYRCWGFHWVLAGRNQPSRTWLWSPSCSAGSPGQWCCVHTDTGGSHLAAGTGRHGGYIYTLKQRKIDKWHRWCEMMWGGVSCRHTPVVSAVLMKIDTVGVFSHQEKKKDKCNDWLLQVWYRDRKSLLVVFGIVTNVKDVKRLTDW